MKQFTIRMKDNTAPTVNGYIVKDWGIYKSGNEWYITDLKTGSAFAKRKTLKEAKSAGITEAETKRADYIIRKPEMYNDYVKAFNKLISKTATAKEGKKMAKTASKTTAKANTTKATSKTTAKEGKKMAKTTAKATSKDATLKKENDALKKEIEILKKQIEEMTKIERVNIDTFDVEGYMATRDNTNRITSALVEALENTDGLVVTRKGADEWVYVSGKTPNDTKSRKEIFKAMGFRWSGKENAWFLAPYPLANAKRWANKKASKANANA